MFVLYVTVLLPVGVINDDDDDEDDDTVTTSLCSASSLGCQRDTAHICCRTQCCGAVAAGRPPLSIDIPCPHGAQQQTRRTPLLLSIDGTDRRTDERTDARPICRPCCA